MVRSQPSLIRRTSTLLLGVVTTLTITAAAAFGATAVSNYNRKVEIPESLRDWVGWIRNDNAACPIRTTDGSQQCLYYGPLQMRLQSSEAASSFSVSVLTYVDQTLITDTQNWTRLPGSTAYWPTNVVAENVSTKEKTILEVLQLRDQETAMIVPAVVLRKGEYRITGSFAVGDTLEAITLPPVGQLNLQMTSEDGTKTTVSSVQRSQITFNKPVSTPEEQPKLANTTDLQVFHLLSDGALSTLTTKYVFSISGVSREVSIPIADLESEQMLQISSSATVSAAQSGKSLLATLKVTPGTHELTVRKAIKSQQSISLAVAEKPDFWPEIEYLSVKQTPTYRELAIPEESSSATKNTPIPAEWKVYPLYLVASGKEVKVKEIRKGLAQPTENAFRNFTRIVWLDASLRSGTFTDKFSGTVGDDWRLSTTAPVDVQSARINGEEQSITVDAKHPEQKQIELRSRNAQVTASGVISNLSLSSGFPITGWSTRFDTSRLILSLPIGAKLFWAKGAEVLEQSSWVDDWSLWKMFFIILASLVITKLYGAKHGALAGVLFVCAHQEFAKFSVLLWPMLALTSFRAFFLLLTDAAAKTTPGMFSLNGIAAKEITPTRRERVSKIFSVCQVVVFTLFCLSTVYPTLTEKVRQILHPSLRTVTWTTNDFLRETAAPKTPAESNVMGQAAAFADQARSNEMQMKDAVMPEVVEASAQEEAVRNSVASDAGSLDNAPVEKKMRYPSKSVASTIRPSAPMAVQNINQQRQVQRIQTGPGVPKTILNPVTFVWNSPVAPTDTLQVYILSPLTVRILRFFEILCLLGFSLITLNPAREKTFETLRQFLSKPLATASAKALVGICLVCSGLLYAQPSFAGEEPSTQVLNDLRTKINDRPACVTDTASTCMSYRLLKMSEENSELKLLIEVNALTETVFQLPGPIASWEPTAIKIIGNNKTEQDVRSKKTSSGEIEILLHKGISQIELVGRISGEVLTLAFPQPPMHIAADQKLRSFELSGIKDGALQNNTLTLTRKVKPAVPVAAVPKSDVSEELTEADDKKLTDFRPVVSITRILSFGLEWDVETTIRLLSKSPKSVAVQVPLLKEEKLQNTEYKADADNVEVSLSDAVPEVKIHSKLDKSKSEFQLKMTPSLQRTERWILIDDEYNILQTSGITPSATSLTEIPENASIRSKFYARDAVLVFDPRNEDRLNVSVQPAVLADGATYTLDTAQVTAALGSSVSSIVVSTSIRASQGFAYEYTLDKRYKLESLTLNNQRLPLSSTDETPTSQKIRVQLNAGQNVLVSVFRLSEPLGVYFSTPTIDFNEAISNVQTSIQLPKSRIVLFVSGPDLGPVVLFWSYFVCFLLISVIASRAIDAPLTLLEWLFLSVGFVSCSPKAFLLVILLTVFFAKLPKMLVSTENLEAKPRNRRKKLLHITGGALATLVSLNVLAVFRVGLLGTMDTMITGNGSSATVLNWLALQAQHLPETAAVVTIPVLGFRVFILCWSLWAVFVVVRLVKWGLFQMYHSQDRTTDNQPVC